MRIKKNQGKCKLGFCDRQAVAKEMCAAHYQQQYAGRPFAPIRSYDAVTPIRPKCIIALCESPQSSRSLCRHHASNASRFRIMPDFYASMFDRGCWSDNCTRLYPLEVDHDHNCCNEGSSSCGKCVRGLLCKSCNINVARIEEGISRLSREDPKTLQALTDYLRVGCIEMPEYEFIYKVRSATRVPKSGLDTHPSRG